MAQIILNKNAIINEFPFADEIHDMADFIKANPQILGSDVVIISRELQMGSQNELRRMDFLVYDTELNQIGIVELKNKKADEKVLLQTLRYANWIRNNPDSIRYQIKKQNLDINEEEIETERIKILIIAPKISNALAELCKYITAFDFEFIQLQRFKDEDEEIYAVTNALEVETDIPTPTRSQGEYDLDWFQSQGVREQQMEDLKAGINSLDVICQDQGWDLRVRYVKWSVRFQTPGGRNAFFIAVRKTQKHFLRFCLGSDFKPATLQIKSDIAKALQHTKETSRWWSLPLDLEQIGDLLPTIEASYANVTG